MNTNQNQGNNAQNERGSQQSGQAGNENDTNAQGFESGRGMNDTYSGSGLDKDDMQDENSNVERREGDRGYEFESDSADADRDEESESEGQSLRSDDNWGGGPEEDTASRNMGSRGDQTENQREYNEDGRNPSV